MRHGTWSAILFALLALPAVAHAQPDTDRVTGIAPANHSLDPNLTREYLRAIEEATTVVTWSTSGESRKQFKASQMRMRATWRTPPGGGPAVMTSATIQPVGSKYFMLGDTKIYKLSMNSKGEITVEKEGADTTISKVIRKANGDLVLDIPWYHSMWVGGDPVIKAEDLGGPIDLSRWPPRLDEVYEAIANRPAGRPGATKHSGVIRWEARGKARETTFPSRGGAITGSSEFDITGRGKLETDGSFTSLGAENIAIVKLNVGGTYERENGFFSVDPTEGGGSFVGNYGLTIPRSGAKDYELTVDGRLEFDVKGKDLELNVPSGTRLEAANVALSGGGDLKGVFKSGAGGSAITLTDGTYTIKVTGPIGVSKFETEAFNLESLRFDDAEITGTGTMAELSSKRIVTHGNWSGVLEGDARGAMGVVLGEEKGTRVSGTVGSDTRLAFDLEDVRLTSTFPAFGEGNTNRTLTGGGEGTIKGVIDWAGLNGSTPDASFSAERARTDVDFAVDVDSTKGLRDGSGTLNTTVTEGGVVSYEGLRGRPVLPSGARTHTVVAGDTLHQIARTYQVPVAALRKANGIAADSSLIRVGDVLRIPSSGPLPLGTEGEGHWTSNLDPGTGVNLDVDSARIGPKGDVEITGRVSATLAVSSADLVAGRLEGLILGQAKASLPSAEFALRPGADGTLGLSVGIVRVPVRLDLNKGTKLQARTPGREMNIVIDQDGSFAEFTVVVKRGADGKLTVDELADAELLLHSNSAATFAGEVVDVSGDKTITYKGRMDFVSGGIDFYGDIAVRVRGDDTTPAVRIRW